METSTGNTFTAGTLDLTLDIDTITVKLHPNSGNDVTICKGVGGVPLPPSDRKKLALSDDVRLTTQGNWLSSYNNLTYLRFRFPSIPTYAQVQSTKIRMEWQREAPVNGAQFLIYDGTTTKSYGLTLPPEAN